MKIQAILLSAMAIIAFFIMATATSQEGDIPIPTILNIDAQIVDTTLVLTNNDTIDIEGAFMTLFSRDSVFTNGESLMNLYEKDGYALAIGQIDTIPFVDFVREGTSFPQDSIPVSFTLDFNSGDFFGTFVKAF